jgi:small subunit ribosomal protein S2
MSNISLSQLLEAGVHFGHKSYRWNPKMFPYIYSEVNNIHILDLVQSASLLNEATNYLNKLASEGKTFLFIGSSLCSNMVPKTSLRTSGKCSLSMNTGI